MLQPMFVLTLDDDGSGIDDGTVSSGTVALRQDGVELTEGVDYTFSYDAAADQITLTATAGDFLDGTYTLAISEPGLLVVEDQAGNALVDPVFTITVDTTPPLATGPAGTFNVTFSSFDVSYNEPVGNSAFQTASYLLEIDGGRQRRAGDRHCFGRSIRRVDRCAFSWPCELSDQSYQLTVDPAVGDLAGNALADPRMFNFTIGRPTGDHVLLPG